MAKILIATTPGSGHVNPNLPIVRELLRRGHQVAWYTGEKFRARIEALGAVYEPMHDGHDFSHMTNRDETFPELAGKQGLAAFTTAFQSVFFRPAPGQYRDLMGILKRFPADAIIGDDTCIGAAFVSEKTGIPLVTLATTIYFYRSRDTAPVGLGLRPDSSPLGRVRNAVLSGLLNTVGLRGLKANADKIRAEVGLSPAGVGVLESVTVPPDLYLVCTVPAFEYPRSDLLPQTRFIGPMVDAPSASFVPPAWWPELEGTRPVVHVTQGTVATDVNDLLVPTLKALANEDVLVVATGAANAAELGLAELPANVRLASFLPHANLLPQVDVMVSNGGYQGTNTALAHGVPLVIAGTTEEKPEVAAHVVWAGAGLSLKTQRPSQAQVLGAVRRVLREPGFRQNARRIQAQAQEYDGAPLAVNLIEALMAGKAGGGSQNAPQAAPLHHFAPPVQG